TAPASRPGTASACCSASSGSNRAAPNPAPVSVLRSPPRLRGCMAAGFASRTTPPASASSWICRRASLVLRRHRGLADTKPRDLPALHEVADVLRDVGIAARAIGAIGDLVARGGPEGGLELGRGGAESRDAEIGQGEGLRGRFAVRRHP